MFIFLQKQNTRGKRAGLVVLGGGVICLHLGCSPSCKPQWRRRAEMLSEVWRGNTRGQRRTRRGKASGEGSAWWVYRMPRKRRVEAVRAAGGLPQTRTRV